MTTSSAIGQKLWNYCNVLRDAGLSYGDYLEQLTYLIFLKMMDERSRPPYTLLPGYQPPPIPDGYGWPSLLARDGDDLETHYRHTLETLGGQDGTLGVIFRKAQNKIQEPAMLTRLVRELIDSENWLSLSADVKGDAYESLLERNAQDVKTGAGQYFTPRPPDPSHRGRHAPRTRRHHLRPGLRHRRLPAGRPRLHRRPSPGDGPGPTGAPATGRPARMGDRGQRGPAVRDEPLPSRHRRRRDQDYRGRQPARPSGRQLRLGADQPALRPQVGPDLRQQRGRVGAGVPDGGATRTSGPPPATSN